MEARTLGTSDLAVSVVGLGCNNLGRPGALTFDQAGTDAVIHAALDGGVTFFDTADIYGAEYGLSETRLGAALRGRRDEAVIATKFGHTGFPSPLETVGPRGSRAYIRAAVEGSLARLGIETIDLYQQHTPDPSVPIAETLGALDELVAEGKVRAVGNSNFDAEQLREADAEATRLGTVRFVSAQNHYSLLARDAEATVLPAVEALGLGFLPFFPLANGLFTGKFSRTEMPADTRIGRQRPEVH
jgi:aryl-alcohol dehydrogenase-like predicted oxidoreductase